MVEFNKIFENKPTTENKRLVLTYPQKSIEEIFSIPMKEQRELINSVCEKLTGRKGLSEHEKSLILFGMVINTNEKLQKKQ